jgi:hypothetical protein
MAVQISTFDDGPLPEEVTANWDDAHAAGYWGVKMDPAPNEDYTATPPPPTEPPIARGLRGPGRPRKEE